MAAISADFRILLQTKYEKRLFLGRRWGHGRQSEEVSLHLQTLTKFVKVCKWILVVPNHKITRF